MIYQKEQLLELIQLYDLGPSQATIDLGKKFYEIDKDNKYKES